MPLYEYQCKPNGHRFEVRHGVNDPHVTVCPECGGEVRRVIQPVGIVFKGSGFYATDSRSSTAASKPPESSGKDAPKDGAKTADTPKSESSSESKPGSSTKPAATT